MKIIIRTPNFIGDTINTTPCLALVKQEYPEAEIIIMGPDFVRDIFKYDERINGFITFPANRRRKFSTYLRLIRDLRKQRGDLGIIFVNTLISAILFKLGNVKYNIGYQKEGRGWLLNFSPKLNYNKHYINRYASLFNEFTGNKYVTLPELYLPHSGKKTFTFANTRPTLGLYLGGMNKGYRKYPDDLSVRLIQLLHAEGYNLVLIGDANDAVCHSRYVKDANVDHLQDLTNQTVLEDFINTISNLDLLITIDSSAIHIAAAVQTPFIGLMGLSTSPTSTILPKVPFGKILKIENNLIREEDYIQNITPEIILKATKERLANQPFGQQKGFPEHKIDPDTDKTLPKRTAPQE